MDSIDTNGGWHRFASSKWTWAGAASTVVVIAAAFALAPVAPADASGGAPAVSHGTGLAPNRIDHSQINWEERTAEPDASPRSIAAYGFGA